MNNFILLSSLLLSSSVSAGLIELKQSVGSTLALVSQNHSLEEVEAISATMASNEVETKALVADDTRGHEEILEFGCHAHGSQMACHQEGHSHFKGMPFSEFLLGVNTAFNAIEKSLLARGISNDALEEAKFWKGGHTHLTNKSGDDEMWAKFTYEVGGKDEVIFTECHRHVASAPFDCHFSFSGEDEPDLGSGHQH
jgi:hypothetical protein